MRNNKTNEKEMKNENQPLKALSVLDSLKFNMYDLGMDIKDAIKATELSTIGGPMAWKDALSTLFEREKKKENKKKRGNKIFRLLGQDTWLHIDPTLDKIDCSDPADHFFPSIGAMKAGLTSKGLKSLIRIK